MAQSLVNIILKTNKLTVNSLVRANVAIIPATLPSRRYSTPTNKEVKEKETHVKKSVFISQSSDIFSNLALEDWFYRNSDFSDHHVLLLWRNSPSVVVGRHQNPWLEANTENLAKHGVQLARRNSGGGTVYHDMGNLNLTFFTPRERYNRKHNLEIISRALFREWGIVTEINSREDLTVRGNYKQISGTAAKLGRPNAYHHCTLLVDVNKVNLSHALQRQNNGFQTNATRSIPSPVMNLCETNNQVKVERLLGAIGWEFLRTCPHTMVDGGEALISKQRGFQLINPTDQWFPGLEKLRDQLSAWDWRFGKTPRFNVERSFHVPQNLVAETSNQQLKITLEVNGGVISDVTLSIPPGLLSANGFHGEARVVTSLRGQRFSEEAITTLEKTLCDVRSQERDLKMAAEKSQFVVDCVRQVMQSA